MNIIAYLWKVERSGHLNLGQVLPCYRSVHCPQLPFLPTRCQQCLPNHARRSHLCSAPGKGPAGQWISHSAGQDGQRLTKHPSLLAFTCTEPLSFTKWTNLPLASLTSLQGGVRKLYNTKLNSEESRTDLKESLKNEVLMPTVRDTHKWRLRQQFCSLSEESKEVGWGNKEWFTMRGTHLSASAWDSQLQVAKEMPPATSKL